MAAPEGCLRCNSTMELMGSDAALDAAIGALVARSGADLARLMHVVERIVASWPEARG